MADPFSVAGTAVGITSLGIQTCQILYNYYSKYKGYHNDIDSVLQQVEGLQGILESLRYVKQRFEIDNHVPSSQLHMALKACEDALARLKVMADKCNTTEQTGSIQSRLRNVKKRLIWPYRKDTLVDMQASLSGFQDNLSLALQCAGFDGVIRKLNGLHPKLDAISHQAMNMEQSFVSQKSVLGVINRGVTNVSRAQRQHDISMSREMMELRDHISACTTIVGGRMDLVARSISTLHDPTLVAPSLLSDAIQILGDIQPQVESSLSSYETHSLGLGRSSASMGHLSLCKCLPEKTQSRRLWGWMTVSSAEIYQHDAQCPQYVSSDYMRSVTTQFMMYNKFLRVCIQAGWQSSRTKGWSTIAPLLRYRALVSQNTGAFKILSDAKAAMKLRWSDRPEKLREEARQILSSTTATLEVSLGRDFSPLDVAENGDGVLHAALSLINDLLVRSGSEAGTGLIDETQSLLDICLTRGTPFDQPNGFGLTPVVMWQFCMGINGFAEVGYRNLHHLVRKTGDWTMFAPTLLRFTPRLQLYEALSELLKSEENAFALDEDDYLYLAIARQSQSDFSKFLSSHSGEEAIRILEKRTYLCAVAAWPEGIEILISKGLANDIGSIATHLWRSALHMRSMRSMLALTTFKLHFTEQDWEDANCSPLLDGTESVPRAQRLQVFDTLASSLSPRIDVLINTQTYGASKVGYHERNLYNVCLLTVEALESLWKFGHHNLDSVQCYFNEKECDRDWHRGTPLWTIVRYFPLRDGVWKSQLSSFRWLLEHGASEFWIHPVHLTTPVHVLIRHLAKVAAKVQETPLQRVDDLLLLEQPDRCVCFCSREGCHVVGGAMSKHTQGNPATSENQSHRHSFHQKVQPYVFNLVHLNCNMTWMSSAVLRMTTFEELSLTHTCCYRVEDEIQDWFQRPTTEEAKIIYDLEREDIKLLENLITEFELEWATYTKPFVTFMNRVWKPRMRAIRAERQVDKDVYEAELQRIGVTLMQTDEEEAEDLDTDSEPESECESEFDSDEDWPDDYESEGDGWYTTDEEDGDGGVEEEEDENSEEEADQPTHAATDDGL